MPSYLGYTIPRRLLWKRVRAHADSATRPRDAQSENRRIVDLAAARKFVHREKNGLDASGATGACIDGCRLQALEAPFAGMGVLDFNHSIRIGEDRVSGIEWNHALLIRPIGEHADGRAAGLEPTDGAVPPDDYRGMVAGIDVAQIASCRVEHSEEQGGVPAVE